MPSFRASSQVASGATSSFSCSKPTSPAAVVAGDVLIAFHSSYAVLAPMGTPTGGATWLPLASIEDGISTRVWWKVAGSSEPSTYGFTQETSANGIVGICAIADAGSTTPVVAQRSGNGLGISTVLTPSTTPTGSADFEVRWAAGNINSGSASWTSPAGFTERVDVQSGLYMPGTMGIRALTSGAATGTHTFTCSASLGYQHGFTVNVAGTVAQGFTGWGMPI